MKKNKGQAIVEYIMLVVMIAVTIAVAIRNTNLQIYLMWTGLARQVAKPCANCDAPAAPDIKR
ncbi:MAG: hypothetical protein ACKOA8_15930 [Deltaproteobacteria bacterium]